MTLGIILAAGRGSRLNCQTRNKTTISFNQKPMLHYGVELFSQILDRTMVIVGFGSASVKQSLKQYPNLLLVRQQPLLGTGHAVAQAVASFNQHRLDPSDVVVGYGDHMMFYTPKIVADLVKQRRSRRAAVALITTEHPKPNKLAWGRILRNRKNQICGIVEQKDATPEQRKIREVNAGFYCFESNFLEKNIHSLSASPVTGEYYLTDMVSLACQKRLPVIALTAPFDQVGIGVNTMLDLSASQNLHQQTHR